MIPTCRRLKKQRNFRWSKTSNDNVDIITEPTQRCVGIKRKHESNTEVPIITEQTQLPLDTDKYDSANSLVLCSQDSTSPVLRPRRPRRRDPTTPVQQISQFETQEFVPQANNSEAFHITPESPVSCAPSSSERVVPVCRAKLTERIEEVHRDSEVTRVPSRTRFSVKKGGLAEMLEKLVKKEKSAIRIWQHDSKSTRQTNPTSLTLEVTKVDRERGCHVVQSANLGDGENGKKVVFVIRDDRLLELNLDLRIGYRISIDQPWRTVNLNDDEVLTGVYFMKILSRVNKQPRGGSTVTNYPPDCVVNLDSLLDRIGILQINPHIAPFLTSGLTHDSASCSIEREVVSSAGYGVIQKIQLVPVHHRVQRLSICYSSERVVSFVLCHDDSDQFCEISLPFDVISDPNGDIFGLQQDTKPRLELLQLRIAKGFHFSRYAHLYPSFVASPGQFCYQFAFVPGESEVHLASEMQ